jgi:hypothetical protein
MTKANFSGRSPDPRSFVVHPASILLDNSAARSSSDMNGTRSTMTAVSFFPSRLMAIERLSLTSRAAVPERPYWVKRSSPSAVRPTRPSMRLASRALSFCPWRKWHIPSLARSGTALGTGGTRE